MSIIRLLFILLTLSIFIPPLYADNKQQADEVVSNLLFDHDGLIEVTSYAIDESGFLNIDFPSNIPDEIYDSVLTNLKSNENINGVLAGRSRPVCPIWPN